MTTLSNVRSKGKRKVAPASVEPAAAVAAAVVGANTNTKKRPRVAATARDIDTIVAAKLMTNLRVPVPVPVPATISTTAEEGMERSTAQTQQQVQVQVQTTRRDMTTRTTVTTTTTTAPTNYNNNNNKTTTKTPTANEVADYVKQLQDPVQLQQQLDAFPTTSSYYLAQQPPLAHYNTSPSFTIPCSRPTYSVPQNMTLPINAKKSTSMTSMNSSMYHPPTSGKKKSLWKIPAAFIISTILVMTHAFNPTTRLLLLLLPTPVCTVVSECIPSWLLPRVARSYSHSIPPSRHAALSKRTLRQFLLDPEGFHLGMAPSFFGFYGYFGMLAAWEQSLSSSSSSSSSMEDDNNNNDGVHHSFSRKHIHGVAGASAGAMAAVLLAAGISPHIAAKHCETLTLQSYADPPGWLAAFQGHLFEQIMDDFIQQEAAPGFPRQLQDGIFPVAVSGFDLKTLTGKILSRGSMAKAARASASFPFLFQPVVWEHEDGTKSYLIDGGITDRMGVEGLAALSATRIVNMVVGQFGGTGAQGPSGMSAGEVSEVLSISIQNLPQGGPWAMANGPRAVEAARLAMLASLDLPLYRGKEKGHYELHIDASDFVPAALRV